MLNSIEHEIVNAHKYKNIKKFGHFLGSDKHRMLFFPLINVKMPTIVGILTFMSRKTYMPSLVEHEKSFMTSSPGIPAVEAALLFCLPSQKGSTLKGKNSFLREQILSFKSRPFLKEGLPYFKKRTEIHAC